MFIIILVFVIFLAGLIFISTKISNLKSRVTQSVLKGTGFSNSEIISKVSNFTESKHLPEVLKEHPEYTVDSLKKELEEYATQLVSKNPSSIFTEDICQKCINDKKLTELQSMSYKSLNILGYRNNDIYVGFTYTDGMYLSSEKWTTL